MILSRAGNGDSDRPKGKKIKGHRPWKRDDGLAKRKFRERVAIGNTSPEGKKSKTGGA